MNTPNDASDDTINQLFEQAVAISKAHAENLRSDPTLAAHLDANPGEIVAYADKLVESVKPPFNFQWEHHGSFRGRHYWSCWDDNTFDGPESPVGSGESQKEALLDLLEKLP